MKMVCSRCGRKLTDMAIMVKSSVTPLKITEDGRLKSVDNVAEPTCEYLCMDCFDLYADCMNHLNEAYSGEYQANMVEVVDDVQYE